MKASGMPTKSIEGTGVAGGMARVLRPDLAGLPQHLVQFGSSRMPCFSLKVSLTPFLSPESERYAGTWLACVMLTMMDGAGP